MSDDLRRILMLLICFFLVLCFNENKTNEDEAEDASAAIYFSKLSRSTKDTTTEKITQKIEELTEISKINEVEDNNAKYNEVAQLYDDLISAVTDSTYAYEFLEADGMNRAIAPHLDINHTELRTKVLILLKTLFAVAPVTTNAVIPKSIVNSLLEIFENDDNLALKAHALDVLHKWLPNNPEIQTQVMMLKGLEPFYMQINKLDISVVNMILDLFNTILKEHVEARSEQSQLTKLDHDRLVLYQKIGLLERMKTANVCNGLVNIFQVVWAYNDDEEVVKTVVELIKNTKPFCEDILKGKSRALALFENLLKFLKDEQRMKSFETLGLNLTDFQLVVEDYVDKVKSDKDEF